MIQEAAALEKAQEKQANIAMSEFEQAKSEVETAIEEETEASKRYSDLTAKRSEAGSKSAEERRSLMEMQQKLALLEVMAVNNQKMKWLEERRKAATEVAEAAKRNLADQRAKEKEALEATRRALEEAKQLKGGGKGGRGGVKRTSVGVHWKRPGSLKV